MKYLLDTSICEFFLRGKLGLDDIIREKGSPTVIYLRSLFLNYAMEQRIAMIPQNQIKR